MRTAVFTAAKKQMYEMLIQRMDYGEAISRLETLAWDDNAIGRKKELLISDEPEAARLESTGTLELSVMETRVSSLHADLPFQVSITLGTKLFKNNGSTLVDERKYVCIGRPRNLETLVEDGFFYFRYELSQCGELLGQAIVNDLLLQTIQLQGKPGSL
jgi:hypothetical protein